MSVIVWTTSNSHVKVRHVSLLWLVLRAMKDRCVHLCREAQLTCVVQNYNSDTQSSKTKLNHEAVRNEAAAMILTPSVDPTHSLIQLYA